MRKAFVLAFALAALALTLGALASAPAAAVGPSLQLTVAPPEATGTPTANGAGSANFTAIVDLFSNPAGRATIALTVDSYFGWAVNPPSTNIPVTAPGRYMFNFTVDVPPDSVAGLADADLVTLNYRVGGVTTYTDQVTVHAMAGGYYAGSGRRVSPPVVMSPGQSYPIAIDIKNDGNDRAVFAFSFPDQQVLDRMRAEIAVPDNPSIAGQNNTTVEFRVKPGGTSPAGKYSVPIRVEIRDRQGQLKGIFNVSMELEVANLAIYQGFLPNWDTTGAYTAGGFLFLFGSLWFARHFVLALLSARRTDAPFFGELRGRLARSHLVGLVRRLFGRGAKRPSKASKKPLTPAEVKARAAQARPQRER